MKNNADHEKQPWAVASEEVQLATWREALVAASGNISRAAVVLGIGRATATRYVKKFALGEFAAKLRVETGMLRVTDGERKGVVLGRPRARRDR